MRCERRKRLTNPELRALGICARKVHDDYGPERSAEKAGGAQGTGAVPGLQRQDHLHSALRRWHGNLPLWGTVPRMLERAHRLRYGEAPIRLIEIAMGAKGGGGG